MIETNKIGQRLMSTITLDEFTDYFIKKVGYQVEEEKSPSFLTGVKELAAFLHMSVSNAERKVCNHDFDHCLYRTGHILLFDKNKLLEGMKVANKKRTKV